MLSVTEIQTADHLREAFLEAVVDTGSITDACDAIGIARRTPYGWIERETAAGIDPDSPQPGSFMHSLAQAKRLAGEKAAGRIHWHSNHSPGMPGVIASIAAAKRYDPLWNDRMEVRHSGTVWHANVDLGTLSDGDRAQLLALAAERASLRLNPPSEPTPSGE